MADYTYTNSARSSSCQQFHPEGHQAQNAKSGRVLLKLCHRQQAAENRPNLWSCAAAHLCSRTSVHLLINDD